MKVVAAVLAAGSGTRFGSDKALITIRGRPLWRWSYDRFAGHPQVDAVGIVCSSGNIDAIRRESQDACFVLEGGETRQQSSRIAVENMPSGTEIAVIHDAARPFVSDRLISDVITAARKGGAAAPGVPISDTVRRVENGGSEIVDRSSLLAMQTPQAARHSLLLKAHRKADSERTEELALLEAIGVVPTVVPGEASNFKVTFEEDLKRISSVLGPVETRMGIGYDVHAFSKEQGRPLMLGGIRFEGERGLEGHSDADPLIHAIVDALLGAAGLGDIGRHFPNSDVTWKNEPSSTFLRFTAKSLEERGWSVANIDATVIAERPRIAERVLEMQAGIAACLGIESGRVSVKGTTNERLGAIGRGEGIAALAIATVRQAF